MIIRKERTLTDEDKRFITQNTAYRDIGFDLDNYSEQDEKIIHDMTDMLGELIGYDAEKDDIDDRGRQADDIISKLLNLLEYRGEM